MLNTRTAALVICAALAPAAGRAATFNFEDLPPGTRLEAQYGPRGVIFPNGAYLETDAHAHSGTRVLSSIPPSAEVFTASPLVMTFTSPQARVAFFAGNSGGGAGTLKAFAANGALLRQDGPKSVSGTGFTTPFEVHVPRPAIVRVEFQIDQSALELIDDLVVEGTTSSGPTTPPTVTFTNPIDGAALPVAPVVLQGTVTGEGLLDRITLRVTLGLPSDSTAPPSDNVVSLTGSGNNRSFRLQYGVVAGSYIVTAIATNIGNLQGMAATHFTVLPDAIRQRFSQAGGDAVFGAIRYGDTQGSCVIAVYERGAIAAAGVQTFIVKGAIFDKWLALRDQGNFMSKVGCPTAEERASLAGARAQEFVSGRIYTTASSAAWVPGVFRDAIETLGGEAATGVAVTDPTQSSGAMQTWLFQRFARLNHPGVEPSTLEIRGSPPALYVERVGEGLETTGLAPIASTPTVYRKFPCEDLLGPCQVARPVSGDSTALNGHKCPGDYLPVSQDVEWQAIAGHYDATTITGWVNSSHMSCSDNPLVHDHQMTNNSSSCSTTDVFPSDWNVIINPLAPFGYLLTPTQDELEIEFEAYYAGYFFAGWGWPTAGNLLTTSGRWILDCGHPPYRSEIHPPFLMSHALTRKRPDGTPETVTEIWVNGYFPGEAINVDIWPPPRPSPDAILTVTRPTDDAGIGLTVALTTGFDGARARFTAPHREVSVDGSGKMSWATGRGYEGEWTAHWSMH